MSNTKLQQFGFQQPIYKKLGENKKMVKEDGFKKVEDKIFKFEKEGDLIEGELISVEDGKTYNNKVYKIKQSDGEVYAVFSTTVMESNMSSVKIGNLVRIVLTGIKKAEKKGFNDTKLFEVFVKEKE